MSAVVDDKCGSVAGYSRHRRHREPVCDRCRLAHNTAERMRGNDGVAEYKSRPLRERLLSKAIIDFETGCWNWAGSKDRGGYGKLSIDGRNQRAHRAVYELIKGPIPEGMQLDHLCRNRGCVNPAHLEPVTARENTLRSPINLATINARRTHCAAGHEYTAENTNPRGEGRICRACRLGYQKAYLERRGAGLTGRKEVGSC